MFGKNPIRSIEHDPTQLAVEAMFHTIQGEGPHAGRPALFIRLAGCNLACHFCDTQFEKFAETYRPIDDIMREIVDRFKQDQRRFVVMTGGEPMRQNWSKLAELLLVNGTTLIQVETAGTAWQEDLEPLIAAHRVELVCSPKTAGVNPKIAQYCNHWKYIVRAGEASLDDGLPAMGTQQATRTVSQRLYRPKRGLIWLSPCDEYDAAKNEANMQEAVNLCLRYGHRLSLQMHKIVGVE